MNHISFTRVTWYSQLLAVVLFVAIFLFGIYLGKLVATPDIGETPSEVPIVQGDHIIASAVYFCTGNKFIVGAFHKDRVELVLSDKRKLILSQTVSADGARYATINESVIFWNKGNTSFIEEDGVQTFSSCATVE